MFRIRRKNKTKIIDEKHLKEVLGEKLVDYIKRDELQEYLANIERDDRKKKLWVSLPAYKKVRVLRYALEKKGGQHDKK